MRFLILAMFLPSRLRIPPRWTSVSAFPAPRWQAFREDLKQGAFSRRKTSSAAAPISSPTRSSETVVGYSLWFYPPEDYDELLEYTDGIGENPSGFGDAAVSFKDGRRILEVGGSWFAGNSASRPWPRTRSRRRMLGDLALRPLLPSGRGRDGRPRDRDCASGLRRLRVRGHARAEFPANHEPQLRESVFVLNRTAASPNPDGFSTIPRVLEELVIVSGRIEPERIPDDGSPGRAGLVTR